MKFTKGFAVAMLATTLLSSAPAFAHAKSDAHLMREKYHREGIQHLAWRYLAHSPPDLGPNRRASQVT